MTQEGDVYICFTFVSLSNITTAFRNFYATRAHVRNHGLPSLDCSTGSRLSWSLSSACSRVPTGMFPFPVIREKPMLRLALN
jgi:hypothetical protein